MHVTTVDLSLELLLKPQLLAFAAAGYDVVGVSAPGPYVGSLEAAGLRHVAVASATRSMDPRRDLTFARDLYRLFRSERPAIVHLHNPKPGWFGRPAARAARVPVVVNTVHGLYASPDDPWARRAVVYGLERAAAACSDGELLQSAEDLPVLRRLRVPADRRDRVEAALEAAGIETRRYFPPAHREPAFVHATTAPLPVTDDRYRRVLSIPFHARVTTDDLAEIADIIRHNLEPA